MYLKGFESVPSEAPNGPLTVGTPREPPANSPNVRVRTTVTPPSLPARGPVPSGRAGYFLPPTLSPRPSPIVRGMYNDIGQSEDKSYLPCCHGGRSGQWEGVLVPTSCPTHSPPGKPWLPICPVQFDSTELKFFFLFRILQLRAMEGP